jgi:hypothetical protein
VPVRHSGEEGRSAGANCALLTLQPSLEDGGLAAKGEDLGVFGRSLVASSRSIASVLVTLSCRGTPVAVARPGIIAQLPAAIRFRPNVEKARILRHERGEELISR